MTTTVDQLVAAATHATVQFNPTRYPHTYACDFLRSNPHVIPADVLHDSTLYERIRHHHPDGWATVGDGMMSRAEASLIRQAWARYENREDEDLARVLADAYLRVHGITKEDR